MKADAVVVWAAVSVLSVFTQAPTNLEATSTVDTVTTELTWVNQAEGVRIEVQRIVAGGIAPTFEPIEAEGHAWGLVAVEPADASSHTDANNLSIGEFCYRVRLVTEVGPSEWSEPACVEVMVTEQWLKDNGG
jgi:hypothetical protein